MGILPHILHRVTMAEVRCECCGDLCCRNTSVLHETLDMIWDFGFAIKPVFLVPNVGFSSLSFAPTMRGDEAIEKHLRLQKQADEFAEKIDFKACVHVRCTRDLAVTQANKLFESHGWWMPALQDLMESSK